MHSHPLLRTIASIFVSAASSQAAVLWTTTFSGTDNSARLIANTPSGAFTDALTATSALTVNGGTPATPFRTGTGNTLANFNPDKNVDNAAGAGWNSIFDYNGGSQSILLSDVTFNIYRFNASGNVQGTDANIRSVLVSGEYTLNGGSDWISLATTKTVNLTNSVTSSPDIALNFALSAPVNVNLATDDFRIRYTVLNDSTNVGAYNGISSIAINGSVVPEPASAALGGLGILLLLRRRRA